MTRWKRYTQLGIAAVVVVTSLTACGEREDQLEEVRQIIVATRRQATQFVYTDSRADGVTTVAGAVEDDFRFKALVSYNSQPAYEQVVHDDTLALRFQDPEAISTLVDPKRIDGADITTELSGVTSLQALQTRRWVIDEGGAPPVQAFAAAATDIGADPVFDAITALRYVDNALTEAFGVDEWRADALNPTYPRSEDLFPAPEEGSGVTRYDLRRLFLPAAGDAGGAGGQRSLASTRNFRKMAIYVKDGRVIRVIERTEILGKIAEDTEEYLRALLEESQVPEEVKEEFESIVRTFPEGELRGRKLLEYLNGLLVSIGSPPVLAREMSLEFESGGSVTVTLPNENVVKGSLDVMVASRQAKIEDEAGADEGETEPGETTETTTGPGETTSTVPGTPPPEGADTSTSVPESSTSSLPIIPG